MIEKQFQSILDYDLEKLNQFVQTTPSEKWGTSNSGRTLLQLAYHKGSALLGTVIVSAYPNSIAEVDWTYNQLMKEVIEEYSEISLCAGWHIDIELILWAVITNEYKFNDHDRLNWLPDDIKNCILNVANLSNTWATWPHDEDKVIFVSIEKWIVMYENWKTSHDYLIIT